MNEIGSRDIAADRRGMLRSAALAAVSGGWLGAGPAGGSDVRSAPRRDRRHSVDFIQTEEGTISPVETGPAAASKSTDLYRGKAPWKGRLLPWSSLHVFVPS
jgi:hypothetical protein